jgi:hypothetical protein
MSKPLESWSTPLGDELRSSLAAFRHMHSTIRRLVQPPLPQQVAASVDHLGNAIGFAAMSL